MHHFQLARQHVEEKKLEVVSKDVIAWHVKMPDDQELVTMSKTSADLTCTMYGAAMRPLIFGDSK